MEKQLRLLVRTRRGSSIVLTLPESKKDACSDWAMGALAFDPSVRFAFEETSGRMLFDRLYDFFRGIR